MQSCLEQNCSMIYNAGVSMLPIKQLYIIRFAAWLWRYSDSIHKCARSWISTLSLMDEYPDFKFVCSQVNTTPILANYSILTFSKDLTENAVSAMSGSTVSMGQG